MTSVFEPLHDDLMAIYKIKYYRYGEPGWGPRMRLKFHYFTPDDYYEAVVEKLVATGSEWADIGCGRDVFPQNPDLAGTLAKRCSYMYGIDPDENINENRFLTDRFQGLVEDCDTDRKFDVVTMRMVAEHITHPERAIDRISRLTKPGGRVVVYTPYKYSPMSIAATLIPFRWHNPLKRLIWDTESRDTFPTAYKLNTRSDMEGWFRKYGFENKYFVYLDDCRIFSRYRALNFLELTLRSLLHWCGVRHPEGCLLAVFERKSI